MGTSLRERIAGLHIARTEALLEPVHTLLRTAMRERLGIHGSARHPLQAVIAHCCCCIQPLAYFPGVEQVSLIGRVSPDAGKAVCLKFQPLGKLVCGSRVLLLSRVHFLLDSNEFLYVMA